MKEKRIDRWLRRASQATQVLVFVLVLFGYFYTVIPVYQKEMLSEQIAEKELYLTKIKGENEILNVDIATAREDLVKIRQDILDSQKRYKDLEDRNVQLLERAEELYIQEQLASNRVNELENVKNSLLSEIKEYDSKLEKVNLDIKIIQVKSYCNLLRIDLLFPFFSHLDVHSDPLTDIDSVYYSVLLPCDAVRSVFELSGGNKSDINDMISEEIVNLVEETGMEIVSNMECSITDYMDIEMIKRIHESYMADFASIPEYLTRNERIVAEHNLRASYQVKIDDIVNAASNKAFGEAEEFFVQLEDVVIEKLK